MVNITEQGVQGEYCDKEKMSDLQARREARRRRILDNSNSRLRRIASVEQRNSEGNI